MGKKKFWGKHRKLNQNMDQFSGGYYRYETYNKYLLTMWPKANEYGVLSKMRIKKYKSKNELNKI